MSTNHFNVRRRLRIRENKSCFRVMGIETFQINNSEKTKQNKFYLGIIGKSEGWGDEPHIEESVNGEVGFVEGLM